MRHVHQSHVSKHFQIHIKITEQRIHRSPKCRFDCQEDQKTSTSCSNLQDVETTIHSELQSQSLDGTAESRSHRGSRDGLSPSLSSVSGAATAAVGLGSMLDRFVTSPSPPPHSEVGEGRGGCDPRDVGHDCAVPTRIWHIHFWVRHRLHLAGRKMCRSNLHSYGICIASHILGECEMFDLS